MRIEYKFRKDFLTVMTTYVGLFLILFIVPMGFLSMYIGNIPIPVEYQINGKDVITYTNPRSIENVLFAAGIECLFIIIVIYAYLNSPKYVEISNKEIIIRNRIGKKRIIPFNEIERITIIKKKFPIGIWRNGGLFGWYGHYYLAGEGLVNLYSQCLPVNAEGILIKTNKKKFYLILDDNKSFVKKSRTLMSKQSKQNPS